ncbi:mfs general substrate transporter [Lichtheimia corymbifera JMRC:FSU:9682]|uniref:Mfs general substrate transporter n=1 Tax=Lichtheimia corymbifera JMRC:FSU:9682 TaxID=1263082 RepID=A0A068S5D4_9FUNG|nr:mfs general substrate transporter [Lichtheimia corymbifera JMRC:FSU:9682]
MGTLSDHIGRRPIMLLGMCVSTISLILFGLSRSIIWAVMSRVLLGSLDSSVTASKVMTSELTNGYSQGMRARGFAVLQTSFATGFIIGPFIGSALLDPVRKYPEIFQQDAIITVFLEAYPYFLPCFAGAFLNAIMLTISFFSMDETCVKLKMDQEKSSTKLLQQPPRSYSTFDYIKHQPINFNPAVHGKQSFTSIFSLRECLIPAVTNMLVVYVCSIFQMAYHAELGPIWTTNERKFGGLGFTPKECAIVIASQGISQMFVIMFILTPLTKRFGTLRVTCIGSFGLIFATTAELGVPYLYNLPDLHGRTQTLFWVLPAVILCVIIWSTSFSLTLVSIKILINNAAPQHALGKTNSIAECLGSLTQAVGPALCGMIWSGSLKLAWPSVAWRIPINWFIPIIVGVLTFYMTMRLNPADYTLDKHKVNRRHNEEQQA